MWFGNNCRIGAYFRLCAGSAERKGIYLCDTFFTDSVDKRKVQVSGYFTVKVRMEYPDSIHAEFTHLGGISAMKTTLIHFKITIALTIIVVCCLTICAVSASESSTTGFSSVVWTPKILTPVTYPVSNSDLIQAAQARTGSVALATQGVSPGTANTESTGGPSQEAYHVGILPLTSPWLTPGISPVKLPSLNSISTIPNSTFTIPTWIPLAPTDSNQTGSGQTSSGKGSLVILGPGGAQGYIINLKSNFYDPQAILGADGLWHTGMGVTPEYWMNLFPPGSYSVQIVDPTTGKSVYCTTVTIVAGQTTTVDPSSDPCPFCSC